MELNWLGWVIVGAFALKFLWDLVLSVLAVIEAKMQHGWKGALAMAGLIVGFGIWSLIKLAVVVAIIIYIDSLFETP